MKIHTSTWQDQLKNAVTNPQTLLNMLEIDHDLLSGANTAASDFPLRVPHSFIARMQKGNPQDPLLLQILPSHQELTPSPGYTHDPLQELNNIPIPGLIHKYHGRVLITLSAACAVNCRYCFRRHFPYHEQIPGKKNLDKILDYINQDPSIEEVILSGGDPLTVTDNHFAMVMNNLEKIAHLKRLRIHTRLPIILPSRITTAWVASLNLSKLQPVIVLHCNHPNEINQEVTTALQQLKLNQITLLNQAVLLKGINDNPIVLQDLNKTLFANGVLPYYLHLLDPVTGSAHFNVTEKEAKALHNTLLKTLPGYLVPKLVREIAGQPFKIPIK